MPRAPFSADIDDAAAYSSVKLRSDFLPAQLTGTIHEAAGSPPRDLAAALNGRIVAVGQSFRLAGSDAETFSITLSRARSARGGTHSSCFPSRTTGARCAWSPGIERSSCSVAWPVAGGDPQPLDECGPRRPVRRARLRTLLRARGARGVAITRRRWAARGGSPELVYDVALWAVPGGIIGGRLYFLATTPGDTFEHWWGPLAVWEGGLCIWGGIVAGTIVGLWRVRRAGASLADFLDAAAPALLVARVIGRVGNYFNQELFGRPTDLPWALEIDRDHRPERYLADPTFHPTFLYELLWNLALGAALVWLDRHRRVRPPGLFALYVTGYCAFRIVDELLRVDPAAHVFGLRWNLPLAIAGTAIGIAWFAVTQRRGQHRAAPPAPALGPR